ncbi:histone chaperone [Scleroderma citrinum]
MLLGFVQVSRRVRMQSTSERRYTRFTQSRYQPLWCSGDSYVFSPGIEELNQELDDCLVGPVSVGVNFFEFEGTPPDPSAVPPEDVPGVAVLILTGFYKDQDFVCVGYYQNTVLVRNISTKFHVTRFQIKCDVSSPQQGRPTAAGAAASAAVPSARDLDDADDKGAPTSQTANGASSQGRSYSQTQFSDVSY